ncbi:hypothetical protein DF18_32520 [Streptomyces rimosus]|uniref:hypothetical protein n=1 Tax=Streptomyces rimosus TaxID=1927 RepID=UPI0004D817DD|nr:hypothetical protein [Streptomyces rimosus]KEF16892.1 hypothetical protein DF18_32520 [Streptomyces rimosus]
MAVDITPEIRYHMVLNDGSDRGISREPYMNWDYCLLANDRGNKGYPVVFHAKGAGFTIEMTSSNWGGYSYLQAVGNGVKLVQEGDAHVWVPESGGQGALFKSYENYLVYGTGSKGWLDAFASILPNLGKEFAYWKLEKAG